MQKAKSLIITYYNFNIKLEIKDKSTNSEKIIEDARFEAVISANSMLSDEAAIKEIEKKLSAKIVSSLVCEVSLKVQRLHQQNRERIAINIYDPKANDYVEGIYCNMLNISSSLNELVSMGTGLMKNDITKLSNIIQKNYRDIIPVEDDRDNKSLENSWESILTMFNDIITQADKDSGVSSSTENKSDVTDYFDIAVKDFNEYIESSNYRNLSITAIRERMKEKEITKCNAGRNDYTLLDKSGKPYKAIRIIKAKLKKSIQ